MVIAAWVARLVVGIALIAATPQAALLQDLQLGAAIYFPASGHVIAGGLASEPGVFVRFKPPAPGQSQLVADFSTLWSPLAGALWVAHSPILENSEPTRWRCLRLPLRRLGW